MSKNLLKSYFPMLPDREVLLAEILNDPGKKAIFIDWSEEQREEFLDFCTGARGVKMLYDGFFKEIMNPETVPERINEFLSLLLEREVKVLSALPNDSSRIADENSLLITDLVVELQDGSIANVEVQKIGYAFPGRRCACYSADLLLRQYKRVRDAARKKFTYRKVRPVYTIVLIEKSTSEFHKMEEHYLHRFCQKSDTGLKVELLQTYILIPLDIFKQIIHNRGIRSKLEAWLAFLSMDEPEMILELLQAYPEFKKLYQHIYDICMNVENVMGIFSEELAMLDRNTTLYMIEEMENQIKEKEAQLNQMDEQLNQKDEQLNQKEERIVRQEEQLHQKDQKIELLERELKELKKIMQVPE